jgi:hypothetical protein
VFFLKRGGKLPLLNLVALITHLLNSNIFNNFASLDTALVAETQKFKLLNILNSQARFFTKFKFLSLFFFEKLNKHIYKYSKYKRPRYSIKYFFVKPFKRFRTLLKFFQKSLIFESSRAFWSKLSILLIKFMLVRRDMFFFKLLDWVQGFVFKSKRHALIY